MIVKPVNGNKLWLCAMLAFICIAGDRFVAASQAVKVHAAFFDNLTHALISGLATLIVVLEFSNRLSIVEQRLLVVCGFFAAALVDVDHFVEAHSWQLTEATRLDHRPFLHCSNIPFLVLILFILCVNFGSFRLNIWLAMAFTAVASHHIRDAARRGFWLRPYGQTSPLPYAMYIAFTVALPFAVVSLMNVFQHKWTVIKEQYRQGLLEV